MSFERRKVRVGRVVDDKMDKTVVVDVEWRRSHQLYRKSVRRKSRFLAHDAENQCRIGDQVRIIETRPLSKTKRWRIADVLAREEIADIQPDEITVDEVVLRAPVEEPQAPVKPAQEPDQEEAVTVATAEEADRVDHAEEEEPSPESETAEEEPVAEVKEEPVAVAEPEGPEEGQEVAQENAETGTAEEEPVAEVKEEPVAVAEPEGPEEGQEEESDAEEKEVRTEAVEDGPKEEAEVEQQASTSEETAEDEEGTDR